MIDKMCWSCVSEKSEVSISLVFAHAMLDILKDDMITMEFLKIN